ncbi:FecR family protein [Herbaspirillum sp. DW155]|uniref:FecR family protein n=1 Tax=Herbaspirillum sp. DW155 TaxID=3095609 RepID=UPI0030938A61|nr:FecR family protein [Herbaspirillum sp. DW155]
MAAADKPCIDSALEDAPAERAIEWIVLLRSGEATPDDYRRFSTWRDANPLHAQAWERLQGMLQRAFTPIRNAESEAPGHIGAMERILLRPPASASRRKLLRRTLGIAATGLATGFMLNRSWPLGTLSADLRTGTGQRKSFSLPDGSTVVLNARSAANVVFRDGIRRIDLRQGELIATVAADPARPFVVQTDHGTARALGTKFLVRRDEDRTMALVLEHSIRVSNGIDETQLRKGQAAWYHAAGVERINDNLSGRAAWADGMLVANEESLADVIAALRPYRKGFIRISPEAARLQVLGAFPLDDTDNVLRSLEQTMSLRVRNYGSMLVTIDLK